MQPRHSRHPRVDPNPWGRRTPRRTPNRSTLSTAAPWRNTSQITTPGTSACIETLAVRNDPGPAGGSGVFGALRATHATSQLVAKPAARVYLGEKGVSA